MPRLYIACSLVLVLCFNETLAQGRTDDRYTAKTITVEETTRNMSRGEHTAFKVMIPEASPEVAKDEWSDMVKKRGGSKTDLVGNEVIAAEAEVKSISPDNKLNIYAVFLPFNHYTECFVFFELDSTFLTRAANEPAYLAAKQFVRNYAVHTYKVMIEEEIDKEEDLLKDLQKELDKLIKDHDKLHKGIAGEERDINTARDKIATTETHISITQNKLRDKRIQISKISDEEQLKIAEKEEKDIEKELKKLRKDKEGYLKDIYDSEADIREAEMEISELDHAIEMKQGQVAQQKAHINKLKAKYESVQ